MYRHDCLCTIGYRSLYLAFVDIVSIRIDVYQNRPRACVGDRGNCGNKSMGYGYDLTSLAYPVGAKGQLERRGARVHSDRILSFAEVCELPFEHLNVPAKHEI